MISHLHKNRTKQQEHLLISNRYPRKVTKNKGDENWLSNTTDNPSSAYHDAEMERISIVEDSGRSFNQSSRTFGNRRSGMSHLTAEEPVLDEMKLQELLDYVRGYDKGC